MGEQHLSEEVPGVREVGLRFQDLAEERQRLLWPALPVEDGGEVVGRLDVGRMTLQLRAQRRFRLRQPALLEVDDAEGGARLRHARLQLQGALQRLDGGVEVASLRVGLAQQNVQLRAVAVPREKAGEDRLRLRRAVAAHEGESVGVLQRRVVFPPRVVAQQLRRLVERFRVEPRDRQHALEGDVARLVGKGAGERPRGLVELLRVEEGHAQRVLHLRKGGVDLRRRLEKLRRTREALPLRLDHAEVQVGAREGGHDPPPQGGPIRRRDPFELRRRPRCRVARSQDKRTRSLRALGLPADGGGPLEGLERRGPAPVYGLQRSHQQPAFDKRRAIAALRALELAIAKAAFGLRHRAVESDGGVESGGGGRARLERASEQERGDREGRERHWLILS